MHNDMVGLWERKIGKTLEKTYASEEESSRASKVIVVFFASITSETQPPLDFVMGLICTILVKSDLTSFAIDPSFVLEASELYPELKYTSVDEYFNQFV